MWYWILFTEKVLSEITFSSFRKNFYLFVFLLEDKINNFATFIRDIYYGSYVLNITYLHPCKFTEWYRD